MPTLKASEIRGYAAKAGFTGADLDIAVAVALAESGGNTEAHNSKPPDDSYGLWQINMLGAMGPDRRKRFGLTSNQQLFDPATNARVAYGIWKSQGWDKGWTTYGTKNFKDFLDLVKKGKADTLAHPAEVPDSLAEKAIDKADDVPKAINAFGETLFKSVTNIGGILVGLSILTVGVIFLIVSSNSAKKALNVAANVIPGGTVVKQGVKGVMKS
jgi:hypothetical protein